MMTRMCRNCVSLVNMIEVKVNGVKIIVMAIMRTELHGEKTYMDNALGSAPVKALK